MPTQRRHGLTTLLLTGDPDARTAHLLTGRKTVVVRPVTESAREPLEQVGDRVLLVDATGRSIAVAALVAHNAPFSSHTHAVSPDPPHPHHPSMPVSHVWLDWGQPFACEQPKPKATTSKYIRYSYTHLWDRVR